MTGTGKINIRTQGKRDSCPASGNPFMIRGIKPFLYRKRPPFPGPFDTPDTSRMKEKKRQKKYSGDNDKTCVKYGMTNYNWVKVAGVVVPPGGLLILHHLFPLQMQALGWLGLIALVIFMAPWAIRKFRLSKVEWMELWK